MKKALLIMVLMPWLLSAKPTPINLSYDALILRNGRVVKPALIKSYDFAADRVVIVSDRSVQTVKVEDLPKELGRQLIALIPPEERLTIRDPAMEGRIAAQRPTGTDSPRPSTRLIVTSTQDPAWTPHMDWLRKNVLQAIEQEVAGRQNPQPAVVHSIEVLLCAGPPHLVLPVVGPHPGVPDRAFYLHRAAALGIVPPDWTEEMKRDLGERQTVVLRFEWVAQ